MKVRYNKLSIDAQVPTKATMGAAAFDVYAPKTQLVRAGRNVINLEISLEIPPGFEGKIEPRSGYSSKGFAGYVDYTTEKAYRFDCDVINGKIDSDYRGPIGVIVNNCDRNFYVKKGQRIAQLTFYKVEDAVFVEGHLSGTDRGEGGYGSSGI